MIFQKMLYPIIGNCIELYYKERGCEVDNTTGRVFFKGINSYIDYSTYFNMFPYAKWNRYTSCYRVGISLLVSGSVELVINGYKYVNGGVRIREIKRLTIRSQGWKKWIVPIETSDNEVIGIVVNCIENISFISDVEYVSLDDLICEDIDLGICICTYKREEKVLNNLKSMEESIINNPNSCLHGRLKIFISDNGSSLDERSDKNINIFHNKNWGGSGGFTRCALEAMKSDTTHFLFMDDDICFEIGVLERTYRFLQLLRPEYKRSFLGAAMLISDKPYIQHAAGEREDLCGIQFTKRGYDLRKLDRILANEVYSDSNYLGWWYCVIPREAFEEKGYSFPMFVQYDDIEFSLRNSEYMKLNVNGIAVWHDDFDKKSNMVKLYYTLRNRLISNSLCYGKIRLLSRYTELVRRSFGRMRRGHYFESILILMAGYDFLKGPEYIGELDLEQKNNELYSLANRKENSQLLMEWCNIITSWIRLFVMLSIKSFSVIRRYKRTANYYTSEEYWKNKLQ